MRIAITVVILTVAAAAQVQPRRNPAVGAKAAAAAASPATADVEALQQRMAAAKADIERMRNIVDQMDRNKAFAAPGETPLKHEFDLEIELWRTLLDHLEKQLSPVEEKPAAQPPGADHP